MVTEANKTYCGDYFCNIHRYHIIMLYTWNEYNVYQLYLKNIILKST